MKRFFAERGLHETAIVLSVMILLIIGLRWIGGQRDIASSESFTPTTYSALLLERVNDNTDALYQVEFYDDGQQKLKSELLSSNQGYHFEKRQQAILIFSAGDSQRYFDAQTGEPLAVSHTEISEQAALWTKIILDQSTPLSGPRNFVPVADGGALFTMTGDANNFANLYYLAPENTIHQVTHAESLVSSNTRVLSTSVEFIAWRPDHPGQFLMRLRTRDAAGTDHNQLAIYDLTTNTTLESPYFGKDPIWSADGTTLSGARFDNSLNPPLYILQSENLVTGEVATIGAGCNPQWSLDGELLAFDGHVDSHWTTYTDCFASGEVTIYNSETGQSFSVTQDFDGYLQFLGWLQDIEK